MVTQWRCQPWHCKASASTMWTPHPPSWPSLSEFYFSSLTIPTDTGDYNAWKKGIANNIRRKKKRFLRINPTVICCCCCCWLRLGGGVVAQADQELLLPGRRAVSHWRQLLSWSEHPRRPSSYPATCSYGSRASCRQPTILQHHLDPPSACQIILERPMYPLFCIGSVSVITTMLSLDSLQQGGNGGVDKENIYLYF